MTLKGDYMKKCYIVGMVIYITILLGHLQYGREEKIINTMVSTSDTFCKQEFSVLANKLFVLDKEKYADELIKKAINNKYKNVHFSYDISGYPNEMKISVYKDKWHYMHNKCMFQILYSIDGETKEIYD